jgi:hypothetical protein
MEITHCHLNDTNKILSLYEAARSLQMQHKMVVWPSFENSFIENEIRENRQWKLVIDNTIACNWAVTFSDPEIWEEKDRGDAIYIHRICNNPAFRGNRFIDKIVEWAVSYTRQCGRRFIRLDTLGNNTRLIQHYTSARFSFLGIHQLKDTRNLPAHYQTEPDCCLFEIDTGIV